MKVHLRIRTAVLLTTLISGFAACAAPVLIVSDGITSSGPIALSGGSAVYTANPFDTSWGVVTVAAESKPLLGSATNPNIEITLQAVSFGSANPLTVILSDNGFGPTSGDNNVVALLTGQPAANSTGDVVTFNTYYDASDTLDALTTLLTGSGSVLPNGSNEYLSDQTASLTLAGPYALTAVLEINGSQAATYSIDANLAASNSPATNTTCNCSIDFSCVPTNLTLSQSYCQSSLIPNPKYEACLIKATDSCLGTVPVEFLGAVTNQVCQTNGYCFVTNGNCFFPNGICSPTNGLCFPANGICFITNGICCPVRNCSLGFENCSLSAGNCFQGFGCSQSFGNCFPSYGGCSQSFGCFKTYGNCSPTYGNCTFNNQSCSTVITYTFGATNGCGVLQTVTQTITVENFQPCFNITCSQPPVICYPQPPQNCNPQPPQNCYPQQPQNCYPQQSYGGGQSCFYP